VALLDKLMNLAGELVLIRNQNVQAVTAGHFEQLGAISQRLNVVTSDLQASIMQTRMRQVGTVLNRYRRIVRDLAKRLDKEIVLDLVGADVELDKNIIEAITDPLTHLVRNAVDHGIEHPDDRRAMGKPPWGRVVLSAFHRAGQVNLQIKDDGRGMDPAELRSAAVRHGLMTKEEAEALPMQDVFNLVFQPGFSTATDVTDLSGRGVGMDVVGASIKKLGGVVDLFSQPGTGTTITINLPLTLAILPALIVGVEENYFQCVPHDPLSRSLGAGMGKRGLEKLDSGRVPCEEDGGPRPCRSCPRFRSPSPSRRRWCGSTGISSPGLGTKRARASSPTSTCAAATGASGSSSPRAPASAGKTSGRWTSRS